MFDIQKFADETAEENSIVIESAQENLEPIPEELAGVSENIAREMMAKSAEQNSTQAENEVDEVDDEGNYTGEKDLSRVKIPYSRFKQTIDQKNELATKASDAENLLAQYRQRFGDLNSQPNRIFNLRRKIFRNRIFNSKLFSNLRKIKLNSRRKNFSA